MSQKFKIDSSKFIYNDEYVENDIDILENISIERRQEEEIKEEPIIEQISTIDLNSDDNNTTNNNPKD